MTKPSLILSVAAGLAISATTAQAQYAITSTIGGAFVDISETGTLVATGDDDTGPVTVSAAAANAAFPAGTLGACTNGHAGYGTETEYFNEPLPSAIFYGGATAAAVFWDDLLTEAGAAGVYSQEVSIGGVTVLVIQWNQMSHYFTSPSTATFQLKIYGGGTASTGTGPGGCFAQFLYQDVDFDDGNSNGTSATIGFQVNGTAAIQYSFETVAVVGGVTLSLIPDASGACCRSDGSCGVTMASACSGPDAQFQGAGTTCGACPSFAACCLPGGACVSFFQSMCTSAGGVFYSGSACSSVVCPMPPGVWIEQGDAGSSLATANMTVGSGPLNTIRGNVDVDDVDMFRIRICDIANFSANTCDIATDTQLFLFNASGVGVVANDDFCGVDFQSTINNSSGCLNGLSNGTYYLAVSTYDVDPTSGGTLIFTSFPYDVIYCPNILTPLDGWTGQSGGGSYAITLVGACFDTGGSPPCYPNCDGGTVQPCLNVQDFGCFVNRFANAEPYANCDNSTQPPVLNIQDFVCFLNRFASGCSNC